MKLCMEGAEDSRAFSETACRRALENIREILLDDALSDRERVQCVKETLQLYERRAQQGARRP